MTLPEHNTTAGGWGKLKIREPSSSSPPLPPGRMRSGKEICEGRDGSMGAPDTALRLGTEGVRCSGKLLPAQASPIRGPHREPCCARSPHPSP